MRPPERYTLLLIAIAALILGQIHLVIEQRRIANRTTQKAWVDSIMAGDSRTQEMLRRGFATQDSLAGLGDTKPKEK